jgi:hypothetical protein
MNDVRHLRHRLSANVTLRDRPERDLDALGLRQPAVVAKGANAGARPGRIGKKTRNEMPSNFSGRPGNQNQHFFPPAALNSPGAPSSTECC